MIDIVEILFSPKVTPNSFAVSGIISIIINEESFGSYFKSSMIFIVNFASCPKEESNNTFDDKISKSASIISGKVRTSCSNKVHSLTCSSY